MSPASGLSLCMFCFLEMGPVHRLLLLGVLSYLWTAENICGNPFKKKKRKVKGDQFDSWGVLAATFAVQICLSNRTKAVFILYCSLFFKCIIGSEDGAAAASDSLSSTCRTPASLPGISPRVVFCGFSGTLLIQITEHSAEHTQTTGLAALLDLPIFPE